MASQQTPNYRLSRWAGTDRILVEEFNDNTTLANSISGNCSFITYPLFDKNHFIERLLFRRQ